MDFEVVITQEGSLKILFTCKFANQVQHYEVAMQFQRLFKREMEVQTNGAHFPVSTNQDFWQTMQQIFEAYFFFWSSVSHGFRYATKANLVSSFANHSFWQTIKQVFGGVFLRL